jgi:quinolinate synthase
MYRISPQHLAWCLDGLVAGTPVNQISVPPAVREGALTALQRMLDNVSSEPVAVSQGSGQASDLALTD